MPAISRFQAAAVGSSVFIHNHRSLSDILVLDVADPAAPTLALRPVTGAEGTPMSRCGSMESSAMLNTLVGHCAVFDGSVHVSWNRA